MHATPLPFLMSPASLQVCQAAAAPPSPALHRLEVPGAPFLLQAHRGHAHRHLPHGDAGGPPPNDLGPRAALRLAAGRSSQPARLPPLAWLFGLREWPVPAKPEMCCHPVTFHSARLDRAAAFLGRPLEWQEPAGAPARPARLSPGDSRVLGPWPWSCPPVRGQLRSVTVVAGLGSLPCEVLCVGCPAFAARQPGPTHQQEEGTGGVGGAGVSWRKAPPGPQGEERGSGAGGLAFPQSQG